MRFVVCRKEGEGGWAYLTYGDAFWVCSQECHNYLHEHSREFLEEFDRPAFYEDKYDLWIEFMGFKEWWERKRRMLVHRDGMTWLGKVWHLLKSSFRKVES